jgi:hypothetical protein
MQPIAPEQIVLREDGYTVDAWDYPKRCADVPLAMRIVRERIEEWDREADPHGWWHERPYLIALYNEVARTSDATDEDGAP